MARLRAAVRFPRPAVLAVPHRRAEPRFPVVGNEYMARAALAEFMSSPGGSPGGLATSCSDPPSRVAMDRPGLRGHHETAGARREARPARDRASSGGRPGSRPGSRSCGTRATVLREKGQVVLGKIPEIQQEITQHERNIAGRRPSGPGASRSAPTSPTCRYRIRKLQQKIIDLQHKARTLRAPGRPEDPEGGRAQGQGRPPPRADPAGGAGGGQLPAARRPPADRDRGRGRRARRSRRRRRATPTLRVRAAMKLIVTRRDARLGQGRARRGRAPARPRDAEDGRPRPRRDPPAGPPAHQREHRPDRQRGPGEARARDLGPARRSRSSPRRRCSSTGAAPTPR